MPERTIERFVARRSWQRRLYDAGWMGVAWPTEFGGQGLTHMHQVVFNEEQALARAPGPAGTAGVEVIGPTILAYGTEKQKQAFLRPMLSGETIWCQGFSEPDAGSDLASISTVAVEDGDGFRITGHKVWSTWSHVADWCALLARTDRESKHGGISYLLIPLSAPGVEVRPINQLNGDTEFGEIILDNVHVPRDALLGELNAGWRYTLHTLSSERGNYLLRRTADLAVDLKTLVSGVAARAEVDAVDAAALGELEARLFALQAQCDLVAERLQSRPGVADATDSLDKMALTDFEQRLCGFARDCLGEYSNVSGVDVEHLDTTRWVDRYLFSRASSIYGGTAQIQRNIVAERLLGLPKEFGR